MKVAVLGCGSIGLRHLSNLSLHGGISLLAYDPAAEPRALAARWAQVASEMEQVWQWQPDVVFVTGPTQTHLATALTAARRGCHLFIEKPLSHSLQDVQPLIGEIRARNLVAMGGCNMRFHPGPAQVKSLLQNEAIGQVIAARLHTGSYLPAWRPNQDYRRSYSASDTHGGVFLDCIHELDLALWMFGRATLHGAAARPAQSLGLTTPGVAEVLLNHESGVLSSVHLNFVQRNYRRSCEVVGETGSICWEWWSRQVRFFGPDGELAETFAQPPAWELNQMYVDELDEFLRAVRGEREAPNPVAEAAGTLELALAAQAAAVA